MRFFGRLTHLVNWILIRVRSVPLTIKFFAPRSDSGALEVSDFGFEIWNFVAAEGRYTPGDKTRETPDSTTVGPLVRFQAPAFGFRVWDLRFRDVDTRVPTD
jgi:hypothetical protein